MNAVYIYGPAGKIAKKVNDMTEYYHTDYLGSKKLVTSENGLVTEEIQYEPFGEQINATEERYTYNGKERDETGLYYYGARYYDPTIGRFISRDPLTGKKESPQTLNWYVYCLNNPLKYTDPSGTEAQDPQQIVEDIFKRMQGLDPQIVAEIQAKLDSGEMGALEALGRILELLGYKPEESDGGFSIELGDSGQFVTVKLDTSIKDWGFCDGKTILLNFGKEGKTTRLGDLALIVLHEVCHATLGGKYGDMHFEHSIMYSVEYSYLLAYKVFLGVEFSTGLGGYANHVEGEARMFDRYQSHMVPVPEIMKKWLPRLGHVVS